MASGSDRLELAGTPAPMPLRESACTDDGPEIGAKTAAFPPRQAAQWARRQSIRAALEAAHGN